MKKFLITIFDIITFCLVFYFVISVVTNDKYDDIFAYLGIACIIILFPYCVYKIIKNKKDFKKLYNKYGVEEINSIKEFSQIGYKEEPDKNFDNCEWIFLLGETCQDFLEETDEFEYFVKEYKKDIKKLSKKELKDMDKYIKKADSVIEIMSLYYDDNGIRRNNS